MTSWTRHGRFAISALALCVLVTAFVSASRAASPYSADAIKAAFLYRFAGYIEWPSTSFKQDSFTIAVFGDDAVAEQLDRLLTGQLIQKHPARVRHVTKLSDAADAQILFIGGSYGARTRKLIEALATKPILVVTDDSRGLELGAMINFVEEDRRVRFEVSLHAAQRSGLKISSELLAVATRVQSAVLKQRGPCRPLFDPRRVICREWAA